MLQQKINFNELQQLWQDIHEHGTRNPVSWKTEEPELLFCFPKDMKVLEEDAVQLEQHLVQC